MDKNNRKSFLVQKVQEKRCCECSEQAVFVEMKKLFCPKHYAKLKHISLENHDLQIQN
tara:strand:+ start:155 stop:328 length:174 start_codon:yes stop_codon:yes gene_type:complete